MLSSYVGQKTIIADESSKVPDNNNVLSLETLKNGDAHYGKEDCLIMPHSHNLSYSETNASCKDPKKKKKKTKKSSKLLSDHLVNDANKKVKDGGSKTSSTASTTIPESSVSSYESSLAPEENKKSSSKLLAMTSTDTKQKERKNRSSRGSVAIIINTDGTSATSKSKKKQSSEVKKKTSRRKRREDTALINTVHNSLPSNSRLAKSFENPAYHATFLKWLINDQQAQHESQIVDPSAATEKINNTAVHLPEQAPLVGLSEVTPIKNNLTSVNMNLTSLLSSLAIDQLDVPASMGSDRIPLLFSTTAALSKPKKTKKSRQRDGSSSPGNCKATNKAMTTSHYDTLISPACSVEPDIDEEFASYLSPPKIESPRNSLNVSPAKCDSPLRVESTTLEQQHDTSFMEWLLSDQMSEIIDPSLANVQGKAHSLQTRRTLLRCVAGPGQTSVLPLTSVSALIAPYQTCMNTAHPQQSPERSPKSSSERVLIDGTPDTLEEYVQSLKEQWLAGGAPLTELPYRNSQRSIISELSDLASVFHHCLPLHVYDKGKEDDDSSEDGEGTDGNTDDEQDLETLCHHHQAVRISKHQGRHGQSKETLPITDVDKMRKKVSFSTVYVRKYSTIMGDNPSCTDGPSLSIGWEYEDEMAFDIDGYDRALPRSQVDLLFSREERENILKRLGYSNKDVADSIRLLIKSKNQRRQTIQNLRAEGWEAMVQSAGRKVKRLLIPSGQR